MIKRKREKQRGTKIKKSHNCLYIASWSDRAEADQIEIRFITY